MTKRFDSFRSLLRHVAPLAAVLGLILFSGPAAADFVVEDIRVDGAQNI